MWCWTWLLQPSKCMQMHVKIVVGFQVDLELKMGLKQKMTMLVGMTMNNPVWVYGQLAWVLACRNHLWREWNIAKDADSAPNRYWTAREFRCCSCTFLPCAEVPGEVFISMDIVSCILELWEWLATEVSAFMSCSLVGILRNNYDIRYISVFFFGVVVSECLGLSGETGFGFLPALL